MDYEAVIGLETHVQLKTRSKMWCGCANRYGEPPNTNVCPVCLGMPGVLPAANEEALRLTALTGMLLRGRVSRRARFDRKNYFYPDVPKNYQITQMAHPSTEGGCVEFEFAGERARPVAGEVLRIAKVRIHRAHLEEDVGKSFHFERHSGVDYNRAGVPLLEIVSEPDIRSGDMAYAYLNALVGILRCGRVSDCDLEKGMVRCDVNVSVRPRGQKALGAKVEIKNMNTFSGIRRAVDYEVDRQIRAVSRGESLCQETRRWDDAIGVTESMRAKEDAHDYRYFPDPDLMPFEPDDDWLNSVASRVVELPLDRKRRLISEYNLPAEDAEVLVNDLALGDYYEAIAQSSPSPKASANWLINNLRAKLAESGSRLADLKFAPQGINELVELVGSGKISSKIAQQVFGEMFGTGKPPGEIVAEKGLSQVSDAGAIAALCDQAIAAHPKSAADFRAGKKAALNFLKGQVMKLSRGKANPRLVGEMLEQKIRREQ